MTATWRIGAAHATRMRPRAVGVAAAFAVILLAGCSQPSEKSIELDPENVASVELYFYEFPGDDSPVSRTTVVDQGLVGELVNAFTDMPVRPLGDETDELSGSRAAGLRFLLDDGQRVDLTQVFVAPGDVAIFWPDGTVESTEWGVPLVDYYADAGKNVVVDLARAPVAELP